MVKEEKSVGLGGLGRPGGAIGPSKCGSTQKMAANVKVVVRVRPLNEREMAGNNRVIVDVVDDNMLVFDPKEEIRPFFYQGVQQPCKNYLKRANKELKFLFDNVCSQEATNKDVFETTTRDMLTSLMEGYNCSVFAYGATGAGKTFTMIGNKEFPGITYLTMDHLFYTISSYATERDFDIAVSYMEVYNENVYDLIKPSKTPLQLREDNKYGVMVAGLTLNNIKTARELLNMLENGNKNRTQHPTDANAESSRSHAVFQVYIKMSYKTSCQVRIVKLSMIDLAGSERASATGCVGDRFKEGANINKSLLSLANCINKLADGCSYIPYRDSKLTRLLKDSLGGNCKTVMIANVSPSGQSYDDTYNTLKYAARANKIQLSIKKNIVDPAVRASQYVKIIEELKKKVKELEAKLSLSSLKSDKEIDSRVNKSNEELRKKVKELEAKLSLSNVKKAFKEDEVKEKVIREWRRRIEECACALCAAESAYAGLAGRARVLALRRRLRARAYSHAAHLAHRSSTEEMDMMCTEDIPREERAAENYTKQAQHLESKIISAWAKYEECKKDMQELCTQALAACPELQDFVDNIQLQSELRLVKARDSLRHKLLVIENDEINAASQYMSEMPNMLKKLYLTLKGYERTTPALTAEYMEIMKKMKSAKGITWSDSANDPEFKFISNLNLDKPVTQDFAKRDENSTIEIIVTDSEDLTDIENQDPVAVSAKKRKGTPMKLANNETIIINDSFENLDSTKTLNSAKKVKRDFDSSYDIENVHANTYQPKDLNSTFDLVGKMEQMRQVKVENSVGMKPVKKELSDRTNTMQRNINFGDSRAMGRVVKTVVGRVLPLRRVAASGLPSSRAGFGSSLARDGTPLQRNVQGGINQKSVGFKAVRARERVQNHPYSRPPVYAQRK